MTFWKEGTIPLSPAFWRSVRKEKRRLRRDQKRGHSWIWIESENLGECARCGDRTDAIRAGDMFYFVADREVFEERRKIILKAERLW
jgi:hypothetical protein